jgi:hypothetical protein
LAAALAECTFVSPFAPRTGGNEAQCGLDTDVARLKIVESLANEPLDHALTPCQVRPGSTIRLISHISHI